ncbi:autotransporter-associated beta strand repeat protein [compost metagenome]
MRGIPGGNDIGGPGRLTKAGSGTLELSGLNSFAGVQVEGGELNLSGLNAFSAGSRVAGGTLRVDGLLQSGQPLAVESAGRLAGGGVIASDLNIDDTLEVSSSTPLTVVGNVTLGQGSRFDTGQGRLWGSALSDNLQLSAGFGQSQGNVSTGDAKADVDVTQLGLSPRAGWSRGPMSAPC